MLQRVLFWPWARRLKAEHCRSSQKYQQLTAKRLGFYAVVYFVRPQRSLGFEDNQIDLHGEQILTHSGGSMLSVVAQWRV